MYLKSWTVAPGSNYSIYSHHELLTVFTVACGPGLTFQQMIIHSTGNSILNAVQRPTDEVPMPLLYSNCAPVIRKCAILLSLMLHGNCLLSIVGRVFVF